MEDTETYLTEKEFAERFNLARKTVRNWRVKGEGPQFLKVGVRCVRYRLADIKSWEETLIRQSTSDEGGLAHA